MLVLTSVAPADAGIKVGRTAPEIAGSTLDGKTFRLSDLRGHPVIVNFWGPSCVPCRSEFPLLLAKLREHASDGLEVVGVLQDDPPDLARKFVADFGATWPTVVDPDGAIKTTYRSVARPTSYFIDRNGVLQAIQIGEILDADFARQYPKIQG